LAGVGTGAAAVESIKPQDKMIDPIAKMIDLFISGI
jgi:hypothetical protein